MTHKQTFTIHIESPHGKQAITNFEHWINKVASESKERWNIDIQIERETEIHE